MKLKFQEILDKYKDLKPHIDYDDQSVMNNLSIIANNKKNLIKMRDELKWQI